MVVNVFKGAGLRDYAEGQCTRAKKEADRYEAVVRLVWFTGIDVFPKARKMIITSEIVYSSMVVGRVDEAGVHKK